MVRKVQFGLHEMRELSKDDRKHIKMGLSHFTNRLPKMVVVNRSGVQMENGIVNTMQSKAVIFHEYQGQQSWHEIIMEEYRFRRIYKFVTNKVTTIIDKREEAYVGNMVVKKARVGRK